jgi:hypothetical protein
MREDNINRLLKTKDRIAWTRFIQLKTGKSGGLL